MLAFDQRNALACACEPRGEKRSRLSAADHDRVEVLAHETCSLSTTREHAGGSAAIEMPAEPRFDKQTASLRDGDSAAASIG